MGGTALHCDHGRDGTEASSVGRARQCAAANAVCTSARSRQECDGFSVLGSTAHARGMPSRPLCRGHTAAPPSERGEKSRCFSLADSIGHVKRMAGRSARRCCTVACSGLLLESARFSNVSSSAICVASQRNIGPNAKPALRIRVRTGQAGALKSREGWLRVRA